MNFFKLKNQIILLTGANSYIGKTILLNLDQQGCKIILILRNQKSVEKIKKFSRKKNIHIFFSDMNNESELDKIINKIKKKFLNINGIINIASSSSGLGSAKYKNNFGKFKNAFNSNVFGPLKIIVGLKNLLKKSIKKGGDASIVNLSSIYGVLSPDQSIYKSQKYVNPIDYGCAKASQVQLAKYLSNDKDFHKIRFNNIIIGPIPNQNKSFKKQIYKNKLIEKIPLGRLGRPEDLIGIVFLLLSSRSSFITGSSIAVDGGWTSK